MVYDWSHTSSPGLIAPMYWVKRCHRCTAARSCPASKLQLGVPAYGRHWSVKKNPNDLCPDGAVYTRQRHHGASAAPGRRRRGPDVPTRQERLGRDDLLRGSRPCTGPRTATTAPTFTPSATPIGSGERHERPDAVTRRCASTPPSNYVTCTVIHVVYYAECHEPFASAPMLAIAAGWEGIYIWALGYETTDVWQALSNVP